MQEKSKINNIGNIPQNTSVQREPIMQGKLTGYASIDKPWYKYYTKEAIESKVPEMTAYEYLKVCNKNNLNRFAVNYFGNKIEYKELLKRIDDVAKVLTLKGIKKGDVVTLCMPTTPETIYTFYALNKIGAVANMVDPRTNSDRIKYFVKATDSKMLIVIDLYYDKVKNFLSETDLENMVIVSVTDSLPFGLNFAIGMKKLFSKKKANTEININDERIVKWKDFLKNTKSLKEINPVVYEKNMPAAMVLTGGTTGMPKAVILSNENLNIMSVQYEMSGIPHDIDTSRFLDIMPPFIAYGLVNGIHMPLTLGMQNILIPKFDPEKFDELILKHKPNHFMGVPTHYEKLIESPKIKDLDMSFLISPGSGGDSASIKLEQEINDFLAKHNCPSKLAKGYGMTELSSAICSTLSNECNKLGSVGIPLVKSTISIFEPGTDKELQYGQKGEICITSPTMMLGYLNNQEEYDKLVKKHSDGKYWVHSNDIGYMDEDGFLFVLGRMKRMIIRPDGHNVFPLAIENIILSNDKVENCSVVGVDSQYHTQGQFPKAVIVLKEKYRENADKILKEIENTCENNFPERDVPYYYEFVTELPLTSIGKIDYKQMEYLDKEEIYKSRRCLEDFGNVKILKK